MKISTLETIFSALNHSNVRYLVAGGIAVNIHGYSRMTSDLDLVINLDETNITHAMDCLKQLEYKPLIPISTSDFTNPEQRKFWIENKNMQVLSLQSARFPETTIDIFVTEPFDFDSAYENATLANLSPEIEINIVNIPLLIEMKKNTGRARDLDDIEHLQIILDEI